MDIKDFILREKHITDTALASFLDQQLQIDKQIDGKLHHISQAITSQILRSGKRLRPLLMRLAYRLAQGDREKNIVQASLFVELVHQFFLIHDDIADRDLQRYGGPNLEAVFTEAYTKLYKKENEHYGRTIAMLAGDHVRTWAEGAILESGFEATKINEALGQMNQVIVETLAGWNIQYQQNFQSINEAKAEEFLKGMNLVSAKYTFEAPLRLGLLLADSDQELEVTLSEFAHHVGMAYQIQDDILGVFGNSKDTGKPVGNDIREGKKTLLVLKAYELGNATQKQLLEDTIGTNLSPEKLLRVQQVITETGSLEYSKQLAATNITSAITSVGTIEREGTEIKILQGLAAYLEQRTF